mmetsp:Transcript_12514/g.19765  ORF Transcript_12514/g.19765 Transcript_12514/m.19765 type:complete len:94 (+) Transcript_12514:484-765(+)
MWFPFEMSCHNPARNSVVVLALSEGFKSPSSSSWAPSLTASLGVAEHTPFHFSKGLAMTGLGFVNELTRVRAITAKSKLEIKEIVVFILPFAM